MRRVGIRIANALLFVLVCLLLASIVNQLSAAALAVPAAPLSSVSETLATAPATWDERNGIVKRNLFGSTAVVVILPPPEKPQEKLEETRLPVLLLGTAATSDPLTARAAISNKSRNFHEVVRVGDRLQKHNQVEVSVIEPGRVVLLNGKRREELILDEKSLVPTPAKVTRAAPKPRARPQSRPRAGRKAPRAPAESLSKKPSQLSKTLEDLARHKNLSASGSGASTFLKDVSFEPEFEGDQMVGVVLSSLPPGSPLAKLGLKKGDRVSQINGVAMTDPSALQQVAALIAQSGELRATVNGRPVVLKLDQIAELNP